MSGFSIEAFDSESFCGYQQITTSYTDFSIAEMFGKEAIKDTYHQLLNQFKTMNMQSCIITCGKN